MRYSKKKSLALLDTLIWIAFKRLYRNLKWVLYCFQKLYLKRVIYIHFLILLIGFEGFSHPQNTFKNIPRVVFIGCFLI